MGFIGGKVAYWLLRRIASKGDPGYLTGGAYEGRSKVEMLLGSQIWQIIQGKIVIDFGCGDGTDATEMALRGAARVIGIDTSEKALSLSRGNAQKRGVSTKCSFSTSIDEKADIITALDSFEHFSDPAAVLRWMAEHLKPDGRVLISFGPPWYHPLGGHFVSVFPWAHLVFTEEALMRWRSDFKHDGAKRFSEVESGMYPMTVHGFEELVGASPLQFSDFKAVPIRIARFFHNRLTREFVTSTVRCTLMHQGRTYELAHDVSPKAERKAG